MLDLPVIHLDAHYWLPGWMEPQLDVWRERVRQLVLGETWIIDGNYSDTFDLRLTVADTIVFLDVPRHICLSRVIVRSLRSFGRIRPDMAPGCRERLDGAFLRWVWTYPESAATGVGAAPGRGGGPHASHLVAECERHPRLSAYASPEHIHSNVETTSSA